MTAIVDTAPEVTYNEVEKHFIWATACRDIFPFLLGKSYYESLRKDLEATKIDEHKCDPPMQPDTNFQNNLIRDGSNEKRLIAIKCDEDTEYSPIHSIFPFTTMNGLMDGSHDKGLMSIKRDEHTGDLQNCR